MMYSQRGAFGATIHLFFFASRICFTCCDTNIAMPSFDVPCALLYVFCLEVRPIDVVEGMKIA